MPKETRSKITVSLPNDLLEKLEEEVSFWERTRSGQLTHILRLRYTDDAGRQQYRLDCQEMPE
ncbi:hypothetical protein [Candidatus Poriferisocius sp.]|uniref:hypothetical protein n=1 Tax=Candidatus Poriferisocius sp. TaxID=3101276 RepID=UPI003B027EFC